MTRSKRTSAALFFCVLGTMLFLPPLVLLFNVQVRVLGVPTEVIYLFVVWLGLIAGTAWFSGRMPHDADGKADDGG